MDTDRSDEKGCTAKSPSSGQAELYPARLE